MRGISLLFNMKTHTYRRNLNQTSTEQEPLNPVGPSGPCVCTQTDYSPSPAPLKCRYLVPQLNFLLCCLADRKVYWATVNVLFSIQSSDKPPFMLLRKIMYGKNTFISSSIKH